MPKHLSLREIVKFGEVRGFSKIPETPFPEANYKDQDNIDPDNSDQNNLDTRKY